MNRRHFMKAAAVAVVGVVAPAVISKIAIASPVKPIVFPKQTIEHWWYSHHVFSVSSDWMEKTSNEWVLPILASQNVNPQGWLNGMGDANFTEVFYLKDLQSSYDNIWKIWEVWPKISEQIDGMPNPYFLQEVILSKHTVDDYGSVSDIGSVNYFLRLYSQSPRQSMPARDYLAAFSDKDSRFNHDIDKGPAILGYCQRRTKRELSEAILHT